MRFEFQGKTYPIILPPEFSLQELCDGENHFGASFDTDSMDARKLASILYVSIHRIDRSVTPAAVLGLDATELAEINEQFVTAQEADASPPAEGPSSEPELSEAGSNDEPDTGSVFGLSSTGSPFSEASAISSRQTSAG